MPISKIRENLESSQKEKKYYIEISNKAVFSSEPFVSQMVPEAQLYSLPYGPQDYLIAFQDIPLFGADVSLGRFLLPAKPIVGWN